ncbi:MAG: ECF transporter S component [Candidatus Bathyarchaeia archaeon]
MNTAGNSRKIVFLALMAALGNVMFIVSQTIFKTTQIALDLSHIGTLIAAVYGGPLTGFVAGLLVGIGPGIYFGYFGGSLGLLGAFGLPIGKALTGATVGYLAKMFKIENSKHPSWKMTFATLVGYVPECIYTLFFFEVLVTILLPEVAAFFTSIFGSMWVLALSILAKAWIEMALLGFFMGALVGNNGFNDFVSRVFAKPYTLSKIQATEKTD